LAGNLTVEAYTRHPWLPECSKTRACCDIQVTVGKDSQSEIFIAAHFPNLAVSLPQYQFASHRLRKLSAACGKDFKLGVVLYDAEQTVPFGERMFAVPISYLWA
jgi:hypothetical protein